MQSIKKILFYQYIHISIKSLTFTQDKDCKAGNKNVLESIIEDIRKEVFNRNTYFPA